MKRRLIMINDYFVTQSLNVAAYLLFKGFQVKNFKKEDGFASFCFDKSEKVFEAVNEYNQSGELKRFINCFREIKKMLYQ